MGRKNEEKIKNITLFSILQYHPAHTSVALFHISLVSQCSFVNGLSACCKHAKSALWLLSVS